MNKFCLALLCLLVDASAGAQTVVVKSQREAVLGGQLDGYATELAGKKTDVQSSWIRFLKDTGKVRQGDALTVIEPVIDGTAYPKGVIYSVVLERGENTLVWLGIKPDEWDTSDATRVNGELQKIVYRYGVKYHRDKIQVQINEAQEASDAVDKQLLRLTNQKKDLTTRLADNEQEKIRLEKSLEANKFENAVLLVKIKNNKKAQDSVAQAGAQIQKVKQTHQERQRKVN